MSHADIVNRVLELCIAVRKVMPMPVEPAAQISWSQGLLAFAKANDISARQIMDAVRDTSYTFGPYPGHSELLALTNAAAAELYLAG